jgi:hypothetical protein
VPFRTQCRNGPEHHQIRFQREKSSLRVKQKTFELVRGSIRLPLLLISRYSCKPGSRAWHSSEHITYPSASSRYV